MLKTKRDPSVPDIRNSNSQQLVGDETQFRPHRSPWLCCLQDGYEIKRSRPAQEKLDSIYLHKVTA